MKVRVTIWVAGSTFTEDVVASRFDDTKKVALARNPGAKVINRKIMME